MKAPTAPGATHLRGALHLKRWFLACLLLLAAVPVLAQSGGGYDLSWSTVDGGGETLTGGVYALSGTAGQPDAGAMSGGAYVLAGGFWPGGALGAAEHVIYLPSALRSY